jgi:hypothetical protein
VALNTKIQIQIRFTTSDYPFGIFKLFLRWLELITLYAIYKKQSNVL